MTIAHSSSLAKLKELDLSIQKLVLRRNTLLNLPEATNIVKRIVEKYKKERKKELMLLTFTLKQNCQWN